MKGLKIYVTAGILAAAPAIASSRTLAGGQTSDAAGHRMTSSSVVHEERPDFVRQPETADQSIAHCVAALDRGSLDERLSVLYKLAAFNDADAFRSLQAVLDGEVSADSPSDISLLRSVAAEAMAMSPYPHARTYLRRFEDDPLPEIRVTVLRMVAAKSPRAAADLLFLRRKTIDPDPHVAEVAMGLLRENRI